MKKKIIISILFFVFATAFFSCTPLKKQIYLQDTTGIGDTLHHQTHQHLVQPGDLLHIKIYGLDEKTVDFFNVENSNSQVLNYESSIFLSSFSVNQSGEIILPVIGTIKLEGLTIDETNLKIQKELQRYVKNATVTVKMANFKITILGEVRNPKNITIYNENITLLEALGIAGDLTHNANKQKIKIIRQSNINSSNVYVIDITKMDFIKSEYYYLKPNDIIYVEPVRAKNYSTNPFPITTMLSIATTALLIMNLITTN